MDEALAAALTVGRYGIGFSDFVQMATTGVIAYVATIAVSGAGFVWADRLVRISGAAAPRSTRMLVKLLAVVLLAPWIVLLATIIGFAVFAFLALVAASLTLQFLMIEALRERHARTYEELGSPTLTGLAGIPPWPGPDMQMRYSVFLWSGEFARLGDRFLTACGLGSMAAMAGAVAMLVAIMWS